MCARGLGAFRGTGIVLRQDRQVGLCTPVCAAHLASWTPTVLPSVLPCPPGRQFGLCTTVYAALPGLLGAKLGSVHPFVPPSLASWAPFCLVESALAALSEPIWAPRWPSELQLAPCTSKMSSNLPFSCPSRALQTFKKCGRVIKFEVRALLHFKGSWTAISNVCGLHLNLLDPSRVQLGLQLLFQSAPDLQKVS